MTTLSKGANAPVDAPFARVSVVWRGAPPAAEIDASAFLLQATGKVPGDEGMVFYGQPSPGNGSTRLEAAAQAAADSKETVFAVDLNRVPGGIERIAFAATLHEAAARGLSFGSVGSLEVRVSTPAGVVASFVVETAGMSETALVLGELYRRNGAWKFRAVGQGFAGGLGPLAEGFGVDIGDPVAPPARPTVDLRKRTVDLTKRDPKLGAHATKALDALEKVGLAGEAADVWLVIDISASMDESKRWYYRDKKVDALVARILAAASNLDDDGEINVVVFGVNAHYLGTLNLSNYREFGAIRAKRFPLEPGTMYGKAIDLVRDRVRQRGGKRPAYVMFVTDGGTQDVRRSKDSITEAAKEPLFWQFMAIGEPPAPGMPRLRIGKRLPRGFDFLAMLDTMEGRVVDNANFCSVDDPEAPTDEDLYGMMFGEFPDWLRKARALGIVEPRP